MRLKSNVANKLFLFGAFSGSAALFLSLIAVALTVVIVARTPTPVNVNEKIMQQARAEYFARNCLLAWLGGSTSSQAVVESCASAPGEIKLNDKPMQVRNLNTVDVSWFTGDVEGVGEWRFTIAATIVPPTGSSTRAYYVMHFVEKDASYQMLVWPRLTSFTNQPIHVETAYTHSVDRNTTLGKNIANFAQAYLVAGDSNLLKRYTSSEFTDPPVGKSPYTSVEVLEIFSDKNFVPANASTGDSYNILVTVKAATSLTTFTTMQLPVNVTITDNKQWVVNSFSDPITFGPIAHK